jgi:hypothetical protein
MALEGGKFIIAKNGIYQDSLFVWGPKDVTFKESDTRKVADFIAVNHKKLGIDIHNYGFHAVDDKD